MLTLIATLIVWAIIQAICNKNPAPLLPLGIPYVIFSLIGEIAY